MGGHGLRKRQCSHNTLTAFISRHIEGAALLASRRVNSFLTKLMTGNNSSALPLTTFVLKPGAANEPFTKRRRLTRLEIARRVMPGSPASPTLRCFAPILPACRIVELEARNRPQADQRAGLEERLLLGVKPPFTTVPMPGVSSYGYSVSVSTAIVIGVQDCKKYKTKVG